MSKKETQAMRLHHEAFTAVREGTGWDENTVWKFIETLPYSEIPDATNALEVLVFLIEHPSQLLADRMTASQVKP